MADNAAYMDAIFSDRLGLIDRATTAIEAATLHGARLETTVSRCTGTLGLVRTRDRQGTQDETGASPAFLRIDEMRLSVRDGSGTQRVLTPTEWRLLRLLADARGRVRTRGELARDLWGFEEGRTSEVEVYISRLRRKLGGDRQSLITTVRGQGYRLARSL